jgi:hypothetical protein
MGSVTTKVTYWWGLLSIAAGHWLLFWATVIAHRSMFSVHYEQQQPRPPITFSVASNFLSFWLPES